MVHCRFTFVLFVAMTFAIVTHGFEFAADDWPCWRGLGQTGIADGPLPPTTWSDSENIIWKTKLPGRGHSSPIVVGQHVYVATADEINRTQSIICLQRGTGKMLWETVVHRDGLAKKMNNKASHASSTVACDGDRLFINFVSRGAVITSALTRDGQILWQTKISDYIIHQGYGSSPTIYKSLVLVSADNKGGGAIAGLKRESGEIVWTAERPKMPNYASPVVVKMHGRDQLVFIGCEVVASFNPATGDKLWQIAGATTECVTSTVTDGKLVFTSGGYPKNHVSAVRGDGTGEIVWENNVRVYVPSMVLQGDYLYAVADAGIAHCWKAATGELMWRGRLGGMFTASPILVDGHLFATNEKGVTFVFKADSKDFQLIAESKLGDQVLATPTVCGGRIYMRVVEFSGGKRQEVLYCIGQK
jgi:outer membrane protein assembly factor BamB